MDRKKATKKKSGAGKSVRDLPVKAIDPKAAKGVKAGIHVSRKTDASSPKFFNES